MAGLSIGGYEEALKEFSAISGKEMDSLIKRGLYKGAGIMATAVKNSVELNTSTEATGQLKASVGISRITLNKNGNWNTKIGFSGYDDKGTPNSLKAAALNSGTSRQPKTQFLDKAVRQNRSKVIRAIKDVVDPGIYELGVLRHWNANR